MGNLSMDIYRYFHPHFNPRLRSIALRQQELNELEQGAIELKRALERADTRFQNTQPTSFGLSPLGEAIESLNYVCDKLSGLSRAHPGDGPNALEQLAEERSAAPGWESWVRLVRERLRLIRRSLQPTS